MRPSDYVLPLVRIRQHHHQEVGAEGGLSAALYRDLTPLDVQVPNGFVVTCSAMGDFFQHNGLFETIQSAMEGLDPCELQRLFYIGGQVRASIMHAQIPEGLAQAIAEALQDLYADTDAVSQGVWMRPSVLNVPGVSSRVTGADGHHLNVVGLESILATLKLVVATLYTDRALVYRLQHGLSLAPNACAIIVQRMVRSDLAVSGTLLTADPDSGWDNVFVIDANYGLREPVERGIVEPDEYLLFKPTLRDGKHAILQKTLGSKALKMVYGNDRLSGVKVRNVRVQAPEREQFCLDDARLLQLGREALLVEQLVRERASMPLPLSIDFAIDGNTDQLFLTGVAPLTTLASRPQLSHAEAPANPSLEICRGRGIGHGNAQGRVRFVPDVADLEDLQQGEILLTHSFEPDWAEALRCAAAILVENGGETSRGARLARDARIPMAIFREPITELLQDGEMVSVSCGGDGVARVWRGATRVVPFRWDAAEAAPSHNPFMLSLHRPPLALAASALPSGGVGLVNLEDIIRYSVRIHPGVTQRPDLLPDELLQRVRGDAAGYETLAEYFVSKLAEGMATVAAAFYPREVIVRLSDYNSAQYASLVGGELFENIEDNPLLGLRGAARYLSEGYKDCFALECEALRRVRYGQGLINLSIMVPFVRSLDEADRLEQVLRNAQLKSDDSALPTYLMCDLPVNALQAHDFLQRYDGLCIGLVDMMRLTLGIQSREALARYDKSAITPLIDRAIDACALLDKPAFINVTSQADLDYALRLHQRRQFKGIAIAPDQLAESLRCVKALNAPNAWEVPDTPASGTPQAHE